MTQGTSSFSCPIVVKGSWRQSIFYSGQKAARFASLQGMGNLEPWLELESRLLRRFSTKRRRILRNSTEDHFSIPFESKERFGYSNAGKEDKRKV